LRFLLLEYAMWVEQPVWNCPSATPSHTCDEHRNPGHAQLSCWMSDFVGSRLGAHESDPCIKMFWSPSTTRQLDEIVEAAAQLLGSQRAEAAELVENDDNSMGVLGFSYGVIDAMCLQAGLGMRETDEAFRRYLEQLVPHVDDVEKTFKLIPQIAADEVWRYSIGTGASAGLVFLQDRTSTLHPQFSLRKMLEVANAKHRDGRRASK